MCLSCAAGSCRTPSQDLLFFLASICNLSLEPLI
jgi:hypothetical protein